MTILVITEPFDVTADMVIIELQRRGARVHRVDTADFPQELAVTATIGDHGQWSGNLADGYRSTPFDGIDAVYFRRPGPFRFPDSLDPYERRWSEQEARMGFGGVLMALSTARWLNHPHAMAAADYKPRQLAVAAGHGLAIPPTLITNRPDQARKFVTEASGGAIYKPLHARPYVDVGSNELIALATTPVTADEITDAVGGTAHLFQHRVPKAYELRVTTVGTNVFAARIDAHSDAARVDWRTDYDNLTYTPVDLPAPLARRLTGVIATLGLVFGAIDLIVTPDGEHVFLEVNPGGQWAWIQEETGLPIAAAIADYLEQP